MPHKDAWGIWRQDDFGPSVGSEPEHCDECGCIDLDLERLIDEDEYDFELEDDWQLRDMEGAEELDHLQSLLSFTPVYAVCDECNAAIAYGPNYYWNPSTKNYDLQRPLTRAEAEKAELAAERARQDAAGQLNLF